ncbi:MAG: YggS family pyridoxal phosphate-dependent enzyme [Verrucomicrobiota bacterium]
MSNSISSRLDQLNERIQSAVERADRLESEVELIAVTKTWPVEVLAAAYEAGLRIFGENKVQEIEEKAPALPDDIDWHLIGHLQKNKVRKVLPFCKTIQTVDSIELAQRIDRIAVEEALQCEILIQVNIASDDSKFGISPEELEPLLDASRNLSRIEVAGLMTVPAFDPDPEKVRPHFANLRSLRDSTQVSSGLELPELSMGMSHDFEVAIEEGATQVRVGSALFGARDYGTNG